MRKHCVTYRLFPPAAMVAASLLALSACSSSGVASSASSPAALRAGTLITSAPSAPPAPTTAATSPADTPPAAGTTLLQTSLDGAVNVISNGTGFTVVQDLTETINSPEIGAITAYDADGQPKGKITGVDPACGAADVVLPSKRRVLLAQIITSTPAEGVNPATSSTTLNEYDAVTGDKLWSASLGATSGICSSLAQLINFTATSDGAYAVEQVAPAGHSFIVNLTTGAKRASTTA
jgi:hypothetical protein